MCQGRAGESRCHGASGRLVLVHYQNTIYYYYYGESLRYTPKGDLDDETGERRGDQRKWFNPIRLENSKHTWSSSDHAELEGSEWRKGNRNSGRRPRQVLLG